MAGHGLRLIARCTGILDELLERLPAEVAQADPELALLVVAEAIVRGDPETAAVHLRLARQNQELPEDRRGRLGCARDLQDRPGMAGGRPRRGAGRR